MKITDITLQARNKDRVNISIDGAYRFSLDVFQVGELGIKVGAEYTEQELQLFEQESTFGKLYAQALKYTLMRPHSAKEIRDYLWRKTRPSKSRRRATGEVYERPGVLPEITDRVYVRLQEKKYIDDEKFARFWVENRNQLKGASQRKLLMELRAKGVDQSIISRAFDNSSRQDDDELRKILRKKASRYPDDQKLIQYLMRQGFRYDDVTEALRQYRSDQAEDAEMTETD